jgi:hypothetical protein
LKHGSSAEHFDQTTPAVHSEVTWDLARTIGFGRDDGGRTTGIQFLAQRIIIEALVGNQSPISMPSNRGGAPTLSCRWPGNRWKRTRLPNPSTRATILVVKPPRKRPIA